MSEVEIGSEFMGRLKSAAETVPTVRENDLGRCASFFKMLAGGAGVSLASEPHDLGRPQGRHVAMPPEIETSNNDWFFEYFSEEEQNC